MLVLIMFLLGNDYSVPEQELAKLDLEDEPSANLGP